MGDPNSEVPAATRSGGVHTAELETVPSAATDGTARAHAVDPDAGVVA